MAKIWIEQVFYIDGPTLNTLCTDETAEKYFKLLPGANDRFRSLLITEPTLSVHGKRFENTISDD